jgi:flagellar biosynthesis protein FlhG
VSHMHGRTARVTAIASGKGGVGKTNVGVNLAAALAGAGRRTLLVDLDPGLANANILLGVKPAFTLADLLARTCGIEDAIVAAAPDLHLLAGHSGTGVGAALGASERHRLARALRPFATEYDEVVVDTGGGLAADALALLGACDRLLVVLTGEPTSFMDAYALVKALAVRGGLGEVAVVTNQVASDAAGADLFAHFEAVLARFLDVRLVHLGSVPEDPQLRKAVLRKRSCVHAFPSARASRAFAALAARIAAAPPSGGTGGRAFFAMESVDGAR